MHLSKTNIGTRRSLIRDWVPYFCIRFYKEVNANGKWCGLNTCVEHINFTALKYVSDVRLNYSQVFWEMKNIYLLGTTPAIISYPPMDGCYNMLYYIYFQRMKTDYHLLRMTISSHDKLRSHLPERNMKCSDGEVHIPPKQRMAYGKTNLHYTPHGSKLLSNK